jgi:hypothetical protein
VRESLIDFEMEPGARWRLEMKLPGEQVSEEWSWLPSSAQDSESGLALISSQVRPAPSLPRIALAPPFPVLAPGVFESFAPLRAMLDQRWTVAIILLRLGYYSFGIAEDERLAAHKSGDRYVKNRQRKGGQSAARFTRNRERWIQELFDEVAEVALSRIQEYGKHIDWLAFGGDRTVLSQFVKRLKLPDGLTGRVTPWRVPVERPGMDELQRAVTSAWSWRAWSPPAAAT